MSSPTIREMTLADCERVSEIRIRGWQHAYRGLMPQPYLDGLSVTADAERRRTWFAEGNGSVVNLVAELDGTVVGWAAHGPYRDGETRTGDAELYAIYVDPDAWSTGAGRALMAVAEEALASEYTAALLWVLEDNPRARGFYERAGFRPDGAEEPFEVDGVPVPEVRYVKTLGG